LDPAGMSIEVVAASPQWPVAYAAGADELRGVLGTGARIEHVGSTAVPGLAAKPILDIDVVVAAEDVAAAVVALTRLGYRHRGDLGVEGREAFHAPDDAPRRNVYVCVEGCLALRNHLTVREVLRARADLAAEYGALKCSLAAQPDMDITTYLAGKSAVLHKVLAYGDFSAAELEQIRRLNAPTA